LAELLLVELLLLLHLQLELLLLLEQLIGRVLLRRLAVHNILQPLHLQEEGLFVCPETGFDVSHFIQLLLRSLLLAAGLQGGVLPALIPGRLRRGVQHGGDLGDDADL